MSTYIARSPYRVQSSSRIKIGFPNFSRMFGTGKRKSVARTMALPTGGTSTGIRSRRRPMVVSKGESMGANVAGSIRKIKEATLKLEFGPSMAIGGLMMIAVLFMLLYLAHFNQVATKGYDLRRLEADRQQLMNQYDIKNMKLAEAKSLTTIISSDKIVGMRRPGEITYVRGNTALASR